MSEKAVATLSIWASATKPPRAALRRLQLDSSNADEATLADPPPTHVVGTPKRTKCKKAKVVVMLAAVGLSFLIDDIRHLALPGEADWYIDAAIAALCGFFCVELYTSARANDHFFFSLFFWFDVTATVGLLTEMEVLKRHLSSPCSGLYAYRLKVLWNTARLGSCSLHLISHLRLMKLKSVSKLQQPPTQQRKQRPSAVVPGLKAVVSDFELEVRQSVAVQESNINIAGSFTPPRSKRKRENTLYKLVDERTLSSTESSKSTAGGEMKESEISKKLTLRLVTSLMVVAVFTIVFSWLTQLPVSNSEVADIDYGLLLVSESQSMPRYEEVLWEFVSKYTRKEGVCELQVVRVQGEKVWDAMDNSHRTSDLCEIQRGGVVATINLSRLTRLFAVFDLCSTFLITSLLLLVSLQLVTDIRRMVLFPLERMLSTVQKLASNPLALAQGNGSVATAGRPKERRCWQGAKDYAEEEVALLETAFMKIGVILGMIYGTAGCQLITETMLASGKLTGRLGPGRIISAVFCFAKITDFESLLECFGGQMLKYVNLISTLLHHEVEQYFGAVNRNLGDSYLFLWKFPAEPKPTVPRRFTTDPFSPSVSSTASLALLFAIKSISKAARSQALFRYEKKKRVKGLNITFTRKLTLGFHAGWAYEGPIGSAFKVDASYLSPNVNLAARVESATKQYGVDILLSEEMYVRLDNSIKPYLRHIDTVLLKGVRAPLKLYSFDLSDTGLVLTPFKPNKHKTVRKRAVLRGALGNGLITVQDLFARSETIKQLRRHYGKRFFEEFEGAREAYFAGKWEEAAKGLRECVALVPFDGPTKALLLFMGRTNYQAPLTWSGVHELDTK